ncbi:uncharacterized protein METZ01_LOCUS132287 [marine metagenome]|uniref:Uncharacterized protein n=1 Tax=marine metagenome TaxID=408172 RepID=A0A381YSC5_9ZZZZ
MTCCDKPVKRRLDWYARERLELVAVGLDAQLRHQCLALLDKPEVMCRKAGITALLKQLPRGSHEAVTHLLITLVRNLSGLDVGSLAESHVAPRTSQTARILQCAVQVRLQHRPTLWVEFTGALAHPKGRLCNA